MNFKAGDGIWIDNIYADVLHVSEPFKCGNIVLEDGTHPMGREVTIFIEEDA